MSDLIMTVRLSPIVRRVLLMLLAVGAVAVTTYLDFRILAVNDATAAFSYLLLVLALATRAGLEASVVASLAGMLCYNFFFLPPVGTFRIADPQNWVALTAFLITAVTASQLSASARKQAQVASSGRREMEKLYEFSRALILGDSERKLAGQIVQQIASVFSAPVVSFYELSSDTVSHAGQTEPLETLLASSEVDAMLRIVAKEGRPWRKPEVPAWIVPVGLGGQAIGSLGIAGVQLSDTVLSALSQLAAIAIERARVQGVMNRAESARQNEKLKSTLLDALAHEFKTPLTSIKAAVSSMLSERSHDPVETELLTIVDEESDRLTNLVTESIKIARIGAGQVRLQRETCSVARIIASALNNLRNISDGRTIGVGPVSQLPDLEVDPDLSELALRQLIGNALKYAPLPAKISVTAEQHGSMVCIHVADEGPGIPEAEQSAVFEKFYRGHSARTRVPGTGMGLTIAREIVHAHGGEVTLKSHPGKGTEFSFTLPIGEETERLKQDDELTYFGD